MISHKIRLHDQMCPGLTIHYDTGMSYCSTLNFRGKSGQPSVKPLKSGLKMWKGVPRKVPKSLSGLLRPLCWLAAGDLWPSPRLPLPGHLSSCSKHCTHFIHFSIKLFITPTHQELRWHEGGGDCSTLCEMGLISNPRKVLSEGIHVRGF